MSKPNVCCICGKTYAGWGNNARPVMDGVCCNICNTNMVIPARIKNLFQVLDENEQKTNSE